MQKIGAISGVNADSNDEWTNGNVANGVTPTTLDAGWLNTLQREMVNIVETAKLTLSSSDDTQVLQAIQLLAATNGYAEDTGAANAYVVTYSPAVKALTDGMCLRFKATTANAGASTLAVNGLTATAIIGLAHSALQGGEIIAGSECIVIYSKSLASFVLVSSSGGALQISNGSVKNHAAALGQITGVAGTSRNVSMSVTAASASATLTADEIIVETAIGGLKYQLSSFSKTINLATTGAGGMDTGAAPASGFVAIYAIYNPATGVSALMASNATSAKAAEVYSGSNMPSGYTASALVSIWLTTSASLLSIGSQSDREIFRPLQSILTSTSYPADWTALSLSSLVPKNAKTISGTTIQQITTASSSGILVSLAPSASALSEQPAGGYLSAAGINIYAPYRYLPIFTAQTIYYHGSYSGSSSYSFTIYFTGYTF